VPGPRPIPDLERWCLRLVRKSGNAKVRLTSKPRSIPTIPTNPPDPGDALFTLLARSHRTREIRGTRHGGSSSTGRTCFSCSSGAPAIPHRLSHPAEGQVRRRCRWDQGPLSGPPGFNPRRARRLAARAPSPIAGGAIWSRPYFSGRRPRRRSSRKSPWLGLKVVVWDRQQGGTISPA